MEIKTRIIIYLATGLIFSYYRGWLISLALVSCDLAASFIPFEKLLQSNVILNFLWPFALILLGGIASLFLPFLFAIAVILAGFLALGKKLVEEFSENKNRIYSSISEFAETNTEKTIRFVNDIPIIGWVFSLFSRTLPENFIFYLRAIFCLD